MCVHPDFGAAPGRCCSCYTIWLFVASWKAVLQNSENKPRGLYFSKALIEGLIFGGAYIRRGLSTEGNLRFKIDWACHIVGSKFTVFALLYFVSEGNFPSTSPRGAYIWKGDLTEGFCVTGLEGLFLEGLIFGVLLYVPPDCNFSFIK